MAYKYLFGPVPSRRLGISLGVDLVPHKTCSLDCVYCECGKTTLKTLTRQEFVPTSQVLAELDQFLATTPALDFITFSGSGEPTLASNIGAVIRHLKTHFPAYKIAVITNSSLLDQTPLQEDLALADVVVPSLDAISADCFARINQPVENLTAAEIVAGLVSFSQKFTGELWLEIFIIPGINTTEAELALLKKAAEQIKPTKIQLNSLDRPGTKAHVAVPSWEELSAIAAYFAPLPVEIISKQKPVVNLHANEDLAEQICAKLAERPHNLAELLDAFHNHHPNDVQKFVYQLKLAGKIIEDKAFFICNQYGGVKLI